MADRSSSSTDFGRLQTLSLIVGVVAVAAALLLALLGANRFFESYLLSYIFWLGMSLGCLVMLFVQHLAGGSWGALIRRPLEAGVAVIPILAILFIPLLFGLDSLYPWTQADYLQTHPTVAAKVSYLNVPFFIVRAVVYFAIWIGSALFFLRLSNRQDREPAEAGSIGFRLKAVSAAWIVIYVLTMTFAGIDWGMSLTPTWFSGIYSVILMIGQAISAVAFIVIVMVFLAGLFPAVNELLTAKRLQDLGNFIMAFIMFWAYVSFSQLIIIWSNNTVETSSWYVTRLNTGWVALSSFLLVFGFFAPFAILFSRWVKRKRVALTVVSLFVIFIRMVDTYWILVPSFERTGPQLLLMDILLTIGLGGIWLAAYFRSLGSRPVLPLHDPRLAPDPHDAVVAPGVHRPAHGGADHA
ncbi:MAG TPA: hypothetical protein VF168_09480 [Trueperaceae bacterium]